MIACQRQCCLCHRLKHTKIQCHHIIPKAEGGEDTFENCIPLCLECHGEVLAYNPMHPIGTEYKPAELRRRRDDWYEKVKNAPATVFDQRHAQIDRGLLKRLCSCLQPQAAKVFLYDQGYGASFPRFIPLLLKKVKAFGVQVESQFLDPTLEGLFAELLATIDEMLSENGISQAEAIDNQSLKFPENYPTDPGDRQKHLHEREDRVRRVERAAKSVYQAYTNLVRECRRKLSIDLVSDEMQEPHYGRQPIDPSFD